mgnify:CR=1 FL=1
MPDLSRFKSLWPLLACSLLGPAACSRGDQTDPVAGAALESNAPRAMVMRLYTGVSVTGSLR